MLRRIAPVLLLALLPLTACGDSDDGGQSTTTSAGQKKPPPEVTDTTVDRRFVLTVKGDRQVTFDGRLPVRFVVREGEGESLAYSIASVTLKDPLPNGADATVKPEVGIAGAYKGDGKYKIPAGIGQAPTTGPTVPKPASDEAVGMSVMQITFTTLKPTPGEDRFGYLLEPCNVEVDERATAGSADCPALLTVKGERVSMTMRWGP